ncbi:ComEC/Rec2 family competence protein [Deltaproteobacteria bacterium OttesenSCG-928-K17]|nr:ComEC/Rec2 family competence protein [Deltaproteobacteria bacterium OttesenSCG-928-K17]
MPKLIDAIMKTGALFTRPILALRDRPLVWLLPVYILGVIIGWRGEGGSSARLLALGAAGGAAAFCAALAPNRLKHLSIPLLMIAALALGWGLTARSLTRPPDPGHLVNFIGESERALIIGGTVAPGSSGRPGQNYRLFIDSREIIVPGPDGPLEIHEVKGLIRLSVGGPGHPDLDIGDYVRLPVLLRPVSGFKNPGSGDYEKFWRARGVWLGAFVKSPALITSWPGHGDPGPLPPMRSRAEKFIDEHSSPPVSGLLAAQLTGRRAKVDQASEDTFRALGLSHILSVSGLHMGVWYGLCFIFFRLMLKKLFRRVLKINILAAILALGPTLFYAALAGSASPIIRSAVTIFAVVLAGLVLKRRDIWNIIFAAAWVILLFEPYRLFTASFQLSFVATAAMLAVFTRRPGQTEEPAHETRLLRRPVNQALAADLWGRLKNKGRPAEAELGRGAAETYVGDRSLFRKLLLSSLAGTFGTAPLVVWHFSRLPLAGIPANIIFTPLLSFLVLAPGLLAISLLPLSPTLAAIPMKFSAAAMSLLMPLMDKAAALAGPGTLLPAPSPFFIAAFYLAGWIFLRWPHAFKTRLTAAALILALGFLPSLPLGPGHNGALRLTVLDVGQGAAVHISCPDGSQVMIDGGGTYNFDPGEAIITPYLSRQGLRRLDVAALTHPDQDHLKGLVSVSRNFKPREIWDGPWPPDHSALYRDFRAATASSRRAELGELYAGRKFGGAEIALLWPPPGQNWPEQSPGADWVNNSGLVFRISWGDISFLVTGDIEKKTEEALAALYGERLNSTVLLAPHHGSRTSMNQNFLKAVSPQWVVFSAGRNNAFGLPHPEAVQRAVDAGAKVWRTDQNGAAVFEVKPGGDGLRLTEPHSGE